jgi:hypothetical protein
LVRAHSLARGGDALHLQSTHAGIRQRNGGRNGYAAAGPPSANRKRILSVDGTAIGCVVTRIVTGMVRTAKLFTATLPVYVPGAMARGRRQVNVRRIGEIQGAHRIQSDTASHMPPSRVLADTEGQVEFGKHQPELAPV